MCAEKREERRIRAGFTLQASRVMCWNRPSPCVNGCCVPVEVNTHCVPVQWDWVPTQINGCGLPLQVNAWVLHLCSTGTLCPFQVSGPCIHVQVNGSQIPAQVSGHCTPGHTNGCFSSLCNANRLRHKHDAPSVNPSDAT